MENIKILPNVLKGEFNMDKSIYIDLMDKVLTAYSDERIREYTERVKQNGIEEHGYPRLAINLGILIAHG